MKFSHILVPFFLVQMEFLVVYHDVNSINFCADGIFGRRDGNLNTTNVSLLNELLQAMDGADVGMASLQGATILSTTARSAQVRIFYGLILELIIRNASSCYCYHIVSLDRMGCWCVLQPTTPGDWTQHYSDQEG